MIDLFCGLKGASQEMLTRGWDVITVDINPAFEPDIVADIRKFSWDGITPDLVWASPPCDEFSRESMPWSQTGNKPDISLVSASKRFIEDTKPKFWVIENVRGAIRYLAPILGPYRANYGPFYLWGNFPDLGQFKLNYRKKESFGSKQRELRAKIPPQISRNLSMAIEAQILLF